MNLQCYNWTRVQLYPWCKHIP